MADVIDFAQKRRREKIRFMLLVFSASAATFGGVIAWGAYGQDLDHRQASGYIVSRAAATWRWMKSYALEVGPTAADRPATSEEAVNARSYGKRTESQDVGYLRSFAACGGSVRDTCVVDGDTFWIDGIKVRIADIDTPEIGEPKCASERALGERAKRRLIQLLNSGRFELGAWAGRDSDKHGRQLRIVVRDGRSLGDQLVSEGLARTWSGRREPWCK